MALLTKKDKIVVITKKTALEEQVERSNTRAQARFRVEHLGGSFADVEEAHELYHAVLNRLRVDLRDQVSDLRTHFIDRSYLPNFQFGPGDIVVTLGPDGLVVNTAKYLQLQPLVAVNPDPARFDGILVPFSENQVVSAIRAIIDGKFQTRQLRMAQADLPDGQTLLAVNDLFIGARTHVSARYRLRFQGREENQSSSGVIVSTGAGSTGWYKAIVAGAAGLVESLTNDHLVGRVRKKHAFDATADELRFCVREPFASRVSSAELVTGRIGLGETLEIVSNMAQSGVIFSDGVESDFLSFDAGTTATIHLSDRRVFLVQPS